MIIATCWHDIRINQLVVSITNLLSDWVAARDVV